MGSSPAKDLTFTYDPMGNRLSKKVFDPSGDILTADYYIRDAQGNVMAVYKLNINPQTQTTIWTVVERNIYGSDRLGVYAYPDTVYPAQGAPTTDYTSVWRGYRKYELKNHLGNVVTVVSGHKIPVQDGSSIGHFTAQIDAAYDYSPFGVTRMEFGEYRYGVGGHEKLDEVQGSGNVVDMGDRWLDVRLGRTPKTDKRASEYPNLSPYSYAANNPIFYVDRDGERVLIHYQDEQGNNQYYEYGSKQDVPNNQFVQATVNALNEIASSPKVAEKLNLLVQTEDYNININQSSQTITWVGTGGYTDKNGNKVNILRTEQDVEFNPTLDLKETSTGLINAPFINLWHELGHQYNAINNLDEFIQRQENNYEKGSENEKWTREEEMYNIQQNEWPLIEDKGGFKRETHKVGGSSGVEKVKTTGSTSVEEDKK